MSPSTLPRPILRTSTELVNGAVRGGLTTRVGFPAAALGQEDEVARAAGREILGRSLDADPARMAWLRQVHGSSVHVVHDQRGLRGEGDALVSDDPSAILLVSVADCGPVLVWDPQGPAFGVAHAGWRGTVDGVVEATVEALERLGAPRARLRAWVGPCIGPRRFEVGPEVATQFPAAVVLPPNAKGRPHVDLAAAIALRLADAGLAPDAVRICGDCTYEREDLYWSYRRDGGICGRQLGFLTRR